MKTRALSLALVSIVLAACAAMEEWSKPLVYGRLFGGKPGGKWTYRWENQNKKAEGTYLDGRQDGDWIYWHENGVKEWEGGFRRGILHGPATFYYDNGQKLCQGAFDDGKEVALWRFWRRDGQLEMHGGYREGRPSLRWTFWHPDGEVLAEGFRWRGAKVGPWTYWDASDSTFAEVHPLPPGIALVLDTWDDGSPRREGFLENGAPTGRWVTRHGNGAMRMTVGFENGQADGDWAAFRADGSPLAVGAMDAGRPRGTWTVWNGALEGDCDPSDVMAHAATVSLDPGDSMLASQPPEVVAGRWMAEVLAPASPAEPDAVEGEPPSELLLAVTNRTPRIPIRPQPDFTPEEQTNLQDILALYDEGAVSTTSKRRRGGGRYSGGGRGGFKRNTTGNQDKSKPFLDHPLPWTRLKTGEDEVLDLDSLKGKRVALVILRGLGEDGVCIYCAAQTKALAMNKEKFDALDTEIIVVYPGDRNRLQAFLASYRDLIQKRSEFGQGPPPFRMAYDEGFDMVNSLDISGNLALPSTFLLDEEGVVRWAFIGLDKVNRPAAKDMLTVLEGWNRP